MITLRVCRPAGDTPAPLVLINHGSPPNGANRDGMRPAGCDSEAVTWFLARGFVVGLPLRRGYGGQGPWAEGFGSCAAPDFVAAGLETARDIAAALDYALRLPEVAADRPALVLGQSAGGWGALALASTNQVRIGGFVNMAGGRGGWAGGMRGANCRPDLLAAAAGHYGATARALPSLWIYTANDSFFEPRLVAAMHAAYAGAGGPAELHELAGHGRDGHGLFSARGGSAIWGPLLEHWMRQHALVP